MLHVSLHLIIKAYPQILLSSDSTKQTPTYKVLTIQKKFDPFTRYELCYVVLRPFHIFHVIQNQLDQSNFSWYKITVRLQNMAIVVVLFDIIEKD